MKTVEEMVQHDESIPGSTGQTSESLYYSGKSTESTSFNTRASFLSDTNGSIKSPEIDGVGKSDAKSRGELLGLDITNKNNREVNVTWTRAHTEGHHWRLRHHLNQSLHVHVL